MGVFTNRTGLSAATLVMLLTVALAAPAVGAGPGSLPHPEDPTIDPPRSLGGVSIGQPLADAQTAWGNPGECSGSQQSRSCSFETRRRGFATLAAIDGEVVLAGINAGAKRGDWVFRGPLMKFRTERGEFGLGDRLTRVAKAYPQAKLKRKGGRKAIVWSLVFREDGSQMTFSSTDRENRRITGISLIDPGL